MKKQMHILEGLMILLVVFIAFLLVNKFIYHISHEDVDTTYMWDIGFDNLDIVEGSKGDILFQDGILSVDVILREYLEYTEFNIDIVNKGMIDAVLEDYILDVINETGILTYNINYSNGDAIRKGDVLPANSKRAIHFKIFYPEQEVKIYDALELRLNLKLDYKTNN